MSGERTGQELVVVGVDGSAESVRALGWAVRYAAATGARVQAMLAWHYPDAAGQPPVGVAPEPVRHQTESRGGAILNEAIAKAQGGQPGPEVETRPVTVGEPAVVLPVRMSASWRAVPESAWEPPM